MIDALNSIIVLSANGCFNVVCYPWHHKTLLLAARSRYQIFQIPRRTCSQLTCCSPVASLLESLFYVKKIVCPCVQLSPGPSYNTAQNIDTWPHHIWPATFMYVWKCTESTIPWRMNSVNRYVYLHIFCGGCLSGKFTPLQLFWHHIQLEYMQLFNSIRFAFDTNMRWLTIIYNAFIVGHMEKWKWLHGLCMHGLSSLRLPVFGILDKFTNICCSFDCCINWP